MSRKEVLVEGPKWVQRLAARVESEANANDLRCLFRTIQTPEGPAVSILMMPAKKTDITLQEGRVPETKRYPSSDGIPAVRL